jgi:hypothetical protein
LDSVPSPKSKVQSHDCNTCMPILDFGLGTLDYSRGWTSVQQRLITSAGRVRLPDPPLVQ